MIYSQSRQYEIASLILSAVCMTGNVSFFVLCSRKRTTELNALRGIFCYITRCYCIHPDRTARLLCRSRSNVLNSARKYLGYLQQRDKYIMCLYNEIKKNLSDETR